MIKTSNVKNLYANIIFFVHWKKIEIQALTKLKNNFFSYKALNFNSKFEALRNVLLFAVGFFTCIQ